MPRSWHIFSRVHATCFVRHLGFDTLMKFSADHRSLGYSSHFRAQVTQAHRKLRGIAWQALETPRRTDGVKRKRLKLRNNVCTWNANRNNNVMGCGSGLSMANCLSLPILLSIFGPMVHILEKEVKNCRNSMLLGLLHVTSYVETENNLFLSCPAITDTKYSPRGFPQ